MILCDTDVFAIYHFFTHDSRYPATRNFIENNENIKFCTTVYNLLELAGILASGGKGELGEKLFTTYLIAEDMEILFPKIGILSGEIFWEEYSRQVMDIMKRGVRYGDAKIIWLAEMHSVSHIVTWNIKHYAGKTSLPVLIPEELEKIRKK